MLFRSHLTAKLAPKHHGPFPIKRVLSPTNYQLTLPEQWKIPNVFHVDILTPYRETEFHMANCIRPPPDLVGEEEQYKVEQVLNKHNYGHWKKRQYLVKWKGHPNSDNEWVDTKDMENTQELIAEFHKSNSKPSSHIKGTTRRLINSHPFLPLPPTLISTNKQMSNASNDSHETSVCRENMSPLPILPHSSTTVPVQDQLHIQNQIPHTL